MITLHDVGVRFTQRDALRGVTLAVEKGTTLALLGPSGCGKSTLLRCIVGLTCPDRGSARVLERDPAVDLSVRRRIGYVIQEGGLFPHLTARDNVALLARHIGWERARVDTRVEELARLVRLDPQDLARFPTQLSGGQRQRVALMRALMPDPDVLLLDEPLGALDPLVRAELQDELRRVFAELKKTTVLVTHDLAEAAHLATQFALLKDGTLVAHGAWSALVSSQDPFVARFVGAHRTLSLPAELA